MLWVYQAIQSLYKPMQVLKLAAKYALELLKQRALFIIQIHYVYVYIAL